MATNPPAETVLILEQEDEAKLRSISRALNDANLKVDWDKRRDLANLLCSVLDGATRLPVEDLI